jgi:uncharacterized protein (TIGR02444 family)
LTAFWDWALEAYARPGVAEACLELQDAHGQNVPLLLWAAWTAQVGRPADVVAAARLARAWETDAVGPLRAVRRILKQPRVGFDEAAREDLRARIKAVELESERVLMASLEALSAAGPARVDAQARLCEAARAYGAPVGPEVFSSLLARL